MVADDPILDGPASVPAAAAGPFSCPDCGGTVQGIWQSHRGDCPKLIGTVSSGAAAGRECAMREAARLLLESVRTSLRLNVRGDMGDRADDVEAALAAACPPAGAVPESRPKIVCLCGSSRFVGEMASIAWALERDEGYIVLGLHLLPASHPGVQRDHQAEADGKKDHFDALHLRKIALADQVLVCNIGGYIGESTRNEIAYARARGKPVRYLEPVGSGAPEEQP